MLEALGSPKRSLAALQGVALSPVSTGIAACLISQVTKFCMEPGMVDSCDGVSPEPNCGAQREVLGVVCQPLVLLTVGDEPGP